MSLQIQRNLQIRIEEQGKRLQEMFEQQQKLEGGKGKIPSSNTERPQIPAKETQFSSGKDKPESSKIEHASIKEGATDFCFTADEDLNKKESSSENDRTKVSEKAHIGLFHESS